MRGALATHLDRRIEQRNGDEDARRVAVVAVLDGEHLVRQLERAGVHQRQLLETGCRRSGSGRGSALLAAGSGGSSIAASRRRQIEVPETDLLVRAASGQALEVGAYGEGPDGAAIVCGVRLQQVTTGEVKQQ